MCVEECPGRAGSSYKGPEAGGTWTSYRGERGPPWPSLRGRRSGAAEGAGPRGATGVPECSTENVPEAATAGRGGGGHLKRDIEAAGGAGLAGLLGVQSQPPPHGRLLPGCPRPVHPEPTASCLCPLCRLLTQQCACRGGHAGGREHWCHLELHVPGLRGERESGSPPEGVLLGPVSFLGVWPRRGTFCVVSAGKRRAHLRPWVGRVGRGSQWTCVASKAGRK